MNNFINEETIAAISTPYGKGGIGIIRISGHDVKSISNKFFKKIPLIRKAEYLSFYDYKNNEILDKGIVLFFKKPNSFTGEDLLEFHGHGNPCMLSHILDNILLHNNVRLALPGEFTKRAYLNNKLDLLQAESIINFINSNSLIESKLSSKSTQGKFSNEIKKIIKLLDNLKILVETYIEFSYEDLNLNLKKKIDYLLNILINKIDNFILDSKKIYLINKGINISIIGHPNVGKSSLFNSLINKNRSIVTSIPGTTRDSINDNLLLNNNININLFDTAGIHKTNDIIENIGLKKTKKIILKSDFIILVIDNNINISYEEKNNNKLYFFKNKLDNYLYNILNKFKLPLLIVKNKSDLSNEKENLYENFFEKNISLITVSVKLNIGINLIKNHIENIIDFNNLNEIKFLICKRHVNILQKSLFYLEFCKKNYVNDMSIFSDNISLSKRELSNLIGLNFDIDSEKILSNIFSKFCIGK